MPLSARSMDSDLVTVKHTAMLGAHSMGCMHALSMPPRSKS
jgi:hypothetical protein